MQKLLSATTPNALSVSSSLGLPPSSSSGISRSTWAFDSGATHHMANDSSLFTFILFPSSTPTVMTANSTPMPLASVLF